MTCPSEIHSTEQKNNKAFTIIELLVVISIIAMLLAIILPALTLTRKKARRIVCASNMSQIAIAMQGYAAKNDDWIIPARDFFSMPSLEEALKAWNFALLPYIGKSVTKDIFENQAELLFCPDDKDPYPRGFMNCPHKSLTSYAPNGYYRQATSDTEQIRLGPAGNYKLTNVPKPSECFLMGETSYAGQFYDADAPSVAGYNLPRGGHHRSTSGFYHNSSMNLLYVDGHVGNIKGRKTSELIFPEGFEEPHRTGKYMYWPDLTLPPVTQEPAFWGPGY